MDTLANLIIEHLNPAPTDTASLSKINLPNENYNALHETISVIGVDAAFIEKVQQHNPQMYDQIPHKESVAENKLMVTKTLTLLNSIAKQTGIDYMLFKTLAPFEFVKSDLDVYIHDEQSYETFFQALIDRGFITGHTFERERELEHKDFVVIDLHNYVSWDYIGRGGGGAELLDLAKFWDRKREISYNDISVNVPSVEDEILAVAAHTVFQHHYLTLGDAIFIGELMRNNNVDFTYMFSVAERYNWGYSFKEILGAVKGWYQFNWSITLSAPVEVVKIAEPKLVYVQSFVNVAKSQFFLAQNKSLVFGFKAFINLLLTFYRYIRYIKLQKALPFNPYDHKH